VGEGPVRPDCLIEVSLIFLIPNKGPKKWRFIIDLRRLNTTLPNKPFRFEGLGTFIRMVAHLDIEILKHQRDYIITPDLWKG
ncbi:4930_t:CDS:2, partial [Ambispora leptoticha]